MKKKFVVRTGKDALMYNSFVECTTTEGAILHFIRKYSYYAHRPAAGIRCLINHQESYAIVENA